MPSSAMTWMAMELTGVGRTPTEKACLAGQIVIHQALDHLAAAGVFGAKE